MCMKIKQNLIGLSENGPIHRVEHNIMYIPHSGIVLTLNIFSLLHVLIWALCFIMSRSTVAVSATTSHDTCGVHEHNN